MNKVILSRKGFDSSTGGYPSPIMPDGTLLSLPIPGAADITYADLSFQGMSYYDIMVQLGIKKLTTSKGRQDLIKTSTLHLDPDIYRGLRERPQGWKPVYGQSSQSASHLDKHGANEGSIILFFGWFKRVIKDSNGIHHYDTNDRNGIHVIYGYMEVGEKFAINSDTNRPEYDYHPHFTDKNRIKNTAYVAADYCSFDNTIAGGGVFKYSDELVLTKQGQEYTSLWELPSIFHPSNDTAMTYHRNSNRWSMGDNEQSCTLQSVGRGQDFVISSNKVYDWAKNLITNQHKMTDTQ